jgi:hypothetical protein
MARKVSISPTEPPVNGCPDEISDDQISDDRISDAAESGDVTDADLSFDPAELEAEAASAPAPPEGRDLFDPAFLGLSQDFAAEANVAKKWDIIKVEKPTKERVFRVHPTMRLKTVLLVLKDDNETYLVLPQLRRALAGSSLCGEYTLLPYVTKAGTPFMWAIRMAGSDGKWNPWHQSAWQIAEKAKERWTRMESNRDAGIYVAEYDMRPVEQQQESAWPDMPFRDWLELAFKGFTIDSLDHPVLKRLRLEMDALLSLSGGVVL